MTQPPGSRPRIQDYAKYGITSVEDKQKLFRLIKLVNKGGDGALTAMQGANQRDVDGNAGLVDLDGDQDGLIVGPNGRHIGDVDNGLGSAGNGKFRL